MSGENVNWQSEQHSFLIQCNKIQQHEFNKSAVEIGMSLLLLLYNFYSTDIQTNSIIDFIKQFSRLLYVS